MKNGVSICVSFLLFAIGVFAIAFKAYAFGYVYSSEQYAFRPGKLYAQEDGTERFGTDTQGKEYLRGSKGVPVFFCKYGNMIAVNVFHFEKPWLWKTGNTVVVLTGNEGDSQYVAHSPRQLVVMDADAGEMSVAKVTAEDENAIRDMRRVEVKDHVVLCYNEAGACHNIRVNVRHRNGFFARIWSRYHISTTVGRAQRGRSSAVKKWTDPKTGLEWTYAETEDGVMVGDVQTFGCAVSPKPRNMVIIPEYIDGKAVKCIGENVIINCDVATVRIPRTVERFSERAPFSFTSYRLCRIEVEDGNRMFQSRDGLLYDASGKVLLCVPRNVSDIQISEGVTNIADSAFDHCYPIESVTIPASVTVLGKWAFFMSSVKTVRFLGDAPKIPSERLDGIYSLTPETLTTYARKDASGWRVDGKLPTTWCERPIVFE